MVGRSDVLLANMVKPPLAIFLIGLRDIGHNAGEIMIARILELEAAAKHAVFNPSLMVRTSAAKNE